MSVRMSRNYKDQHWKALKFDTEEDWQKGIDIFVDRMETRYLLHIRRLLGHTTSGFAALALDCIVVETMEQFRQGTKKTPYKKAQAYFVSFLTRTSFSAYISEHQARKFYTQIRCGLLHQAEAEDSLIKRNRSNPLLTTTEDGKGLIVNANLFHTHLEKVIQEYTAILRNPASTQERIAFRKKMNFICAVEESPAETAGAQAPIRLIYPDTIIWNLLFDQNIEPQKLLAALRNKECTLVVSFHTIYELARNFERDEAAGNARGQQLFSYLKQYLDLDIPSTKLLWELIVAEAYAFENHLAAIDPMAAPEQAAIEKQEVEKLANGIVDGRVKAFLEERRQFAKDTKAQQEARIIESDTLREYLKAIPESELIQWMPEETLTPSGINTLYERFIRRIGSGATPEYISNLLRFPLCGCMQGHDTCRSVFQLEMRSGWFESDGPIR